MEMNFEKEEFSGESVRDREQQQKKTTAAKFEQNRKKIKKIET